MAYLYNATEFPSAAASAQINPQDPKNLTTPESPRMKTHTAKLRPPLSPEKLHSPPYHYFQINWPPFLEDNLHIPSSDDHHLKIPRSCLAQGFIDVIAVEYPNRLTPGKIRERQGARRSRNEDSLGHTRRADHHWAWLEWGGGGWYYHSEIIR